MADEKKLDETVEGGKYIAGDRFVDANGKDLGPAGKQAKADPTDAEPAAETTKKK